MRLITILIILSPMFTYAEYKYDSSTGNSYNTYGSTTYGYNANTGSTWSQTNTGSSYSGLDSGGNSYQGDRATGYYQNNGSGVVCTGIGAARVCN